MGKAATEQEKLRQAKARLRRIQHYEQVTHNVNQICRFFGVSRRQFYTWLKRYREHGLEGLKNLKSGSRKPHLATPPHIVALILRVRAERQYGPIRICLYLQRFHQVYVSVPTIYKILKRHGVPPGLDEAVPARAAAPPRVHRARTVRPGGRQAPQARGPALLSIHGGG